MRLVRLVNLLMVYYFRMDSPTVLVENGKQKTVRGFVRRGKLYSLYYYRSLKKEKKLA